MDKAGKRFLGLLGSAIFGVVFNAIVAIAAGTVVGVFGKAHKDGTAYMVVLEVASGLIVFIVLTTLYLVKVGPWLAKFRPDPPSLQNLGDLADSYASQILRFEHRGPDGTWIPHDQRPLLDNLSEMSDSNRITDDYVRFDHEYGNDMRSIFHKLKHAGLVDDSESFLFYSPRLTEDRVKLAFRLREMAAAARDRG
jgi:hypothetical protein